MAVKLLIDHFICTSFHLIYQAFGAPIAKNLMMNFKTDQALTTKLSDFS